MIIYCECKITVNFTPYNYTKENPAPLININFCKRFTLVLEQNKQTDCCL